MGVLWAMDNRAAQGPRSEEVGKWSGIHFGSQEYSGFWPLYPKHMAIRLKSIDASSQCSRTHCLSERRREQVALLRIELDAWQEVAERNERRARM